MIGAIIGTAFVYDMFYKKIPNYVSAAGYITALPICFMERNLIYSLISLAVTGYAGYIMYLVGAIGAGDVKLLGIVAMYNGSLAVNLRYGILILFIGAFMGIIKCLLSGFSQRTIKFTAPILAGYLIMLVSKGGVT